MNVWHMSGAGNDFMVLDARGKKLDLPQLARQLCALSGADGFMAVDEAREEDFTLHFYNSDGSRGEMCGNGSRCVCKFAYDRGIAGEAMTLRTDAGRVYGWRLGEDRYRVQLNEPGVLDLDRLPEAAYVELGDPGVPHGVVELPELNFSQGEALRQRARQLRFHPAFPKGANINFFCRLDRDRVRVMTYERGVEDYTLACGTGCGSIACALWARGELPQGHLICENRGGVLEVTRTPGRLLLEGSAVLVREYALEL